MFYQNLIVVTACLAFALSGCQGDGGKPHDFAHDHDHEHHHDHDHDHHHHDHDHDEASHLELTPEHIQLAEIEIEYAKPGSVTLKTCSTGKVILDENRYFHVVPKADGIALEIFAYLGDVVHEGDILANLESKEIAESKAIYLAALRKNELRHNILAREQELKNKKISAEQDYLEAQNVADEAAVELELAMHNLRTLGLSQYEIDSFTSGQDGNLRLYNLRAPANGTIIERHITSGEVLDSDHEVYAIADLSNLWVELFLHPKDLKGVKIGQTVDISATTHDQKGEARIAYISPLIDEETRSAHVIAELDNKDGAWRPGTFVCAEIITKNIQAPIVLEKEAVQAIDGENYVFVKNDEGFEKRLVYVGSSDDQHVEIISGLSKGEPYASKNAYVLKVELSKTPHEH